MKDVPQWRFHTFLCTWVSYFRTIKVYKSNLYFIYLLCMTVNELAAMNIRLTLDVCS